MTQDLDQVFEDTFGSLYCPDCGQQSTHRYTCVPEHTRQYHTPDDDTQHVTHMPATRDYGCRDCGFEWSVDEARLEYHE